MSHVRESVRRMTEERRLPVTPKALAEICLDCRDLSGGIVELDRRSLHPVGLEERIAEAVQIAMEAEQARCAAVLEKQLGFALGNDASPNCRHCADHLRAVLRRVRNGGN